MSAIGLRESQTKFDVAKVDFRTLKNAAESYFVDELPERALHGLVISEATRRYVTEDRSPPGAEDQTQMFDLVEIIQDWGFASTPQRVQSILHTLQMQGFVTEGIPELDLVAPKYHFLLTSEGVDEGLQLISNYMRFANEHEENDRISSNADYKVDSSAWTGPPLVLMDAQKLREVRLLARSLQVRSREVNYISEADRLDIQNLADALVSVSGMIEPDLDLLHQIACHPKFKTYAAIAVCVATIRGALGI